jgi:exonuclease SbcC
MIDTITAKNFQSHEDTIIKLSYGVNAFIGPSDSGKTAIFRLLDWIINNRPGGNEFRSWWGGDTVGGIDLKEGIIVKRVKTDSDNLYTVTNKNGEEDEYRAFGQKVPEDIKTILNMSTINFRFQLDSPFMLGQSAGANARYLNSVINLDIIDDVLSNINKRFKEEKRILENENVEKEKLEEDLKQYDWLNNAEKKIEELEKIDFEFRKLKEDYIQIII